MLTGLKKLYIQNMDKHIRGFIHIHVDMLYIGETGATFLSHSAYIRASRNIIVAPASPMEAECHSHSFSHSHFCSPLFLSMVT